MTINNKELAQKFHGMLVRSNNNSSVIDQINKALEELTPADVKEILDYIEQQAKHSVEGMVYNHKSYEPQPLKSCENSGILEVIKALRQGEKKAK